MAKMINGVRSAGEFAVDFLKENTSWENRPLTVGAVQGIVADRSNEFAVRLAEIAETLNTLGPDAALGAIERTYETLTGCRMAVSQRQPYPIVLPERSWTPFEAPYVYPCDRIRVAPCDFGIAIMTADNAPLVMRPMAAHLVHVVVDQKGR